MDLNEAIRHIVREEITAASDGTLPDLIDAAAFAEKYDIDKTTLGNLIENHEKNGFPVVIFGPRTRRIDVRRFTAWAANGGLELAK